MTKCSETRLRQCRHSSKACRNHTVAWRVDGYGYSPIFSGRGVMQNATGSPAIACPYPAKLVERDESRRQYIVPCDHLCRSNPRIASTLCLGPEHCDLR